MVRDPAERERRTERRGRDKCRRNKERKRGGRRKERRGEERKVEEEAGGGYIPPLSPLSEGFWTGRGPAEREGKRWRVEERRGMEGRGGAGVAFVCFPRFKASLEK